MNRKLILVLVVLALVVVVSGCVQPPAPSGEQQIKSQEDAQKAIKNITTDLDDAETTLAELENILE